MTAYVDPLFSTPKSARWPYKAACHLAADDVAELHTLAVAIGLNPLWFQEDRHRRFWMPHYDLTPAKRTAAIAAGAVEVAARDLVERAVWITRHDDGVEELGIGSPLLRWAITGVPMAWKELP